MSLATELAQHVKGFLLVMGFAQDITIAYNNGICCEKDDTLLICMFRCMLLAVVTIGSSLLSSDKFSHAGGKQ